MRTPMVPVQKIGTPFQRPSWRVDALRNPDRYGFRAFCSQTADNAGHLKRLITKGVRPVRKYRIPRTLQLAAETMPANLRTRLEQVWSRHWRRAHNGRIEFEPVSAISDFISWNVRKVARLNDRWFIRLINHVFNVRYDDSVDFALRMQTDQQYVQTRRFIGFAIFSGLADKNIAMQWHIPVRYVEAIRMLFYDFSYFPKDKVAQWALLKELGDAGEIRREDFMLYKKIFEFEGFVGLKAFVLPHQLSDEETEKVRGYLHRASMGNTLALGLGASSKNDILTYNRVLHEDATLQLKREEINLRRQEVRMVELQTRKVERDLQQMQVVSAVTDDDTRLLQNTIRHLSTLDNDPNVPSFAALLQDGTK